VYKRLIPGVTPKEELEKNPMQYVTNKNIIGKIRKLSMTVNLMPEGSYKGGNLKFDFGPHSHGKRYHECVEIRPQGSVIVFPSYIYHQVTPVTEGTRYSLVMWTLGKPFK
jgi:PKHD-type hydroxylase